MERLLSSGATLHATGQTSSRRFREPSGILGSQDAFEMHLLDAMSIQVAEAQTWNDNGDNDTISYDYGMKLSCNKCD